MSSKQEWEELVESLKTPMPTESSKKEELKAAVAYAESCGILVSMWVRTLAQTVDEKTAEELDRLKGEEVYQKSNADEKKLLLHAAVSELRAKLEYAEKLEDLIKRRCSVGQSLLKSNDNESQTAQTKYNY